MSHSNKRIALVNVVNSNSEGKLRIPVGLIYLGSALKKHGYDVKIYQPIQHEEEIRHVEEKIIRDKPLYVGFSVFMGPGSITSLEMSRRLKITLGTKIVWGGKFPSSIYEQIIKEDCIDVVCLGEGETTVVDLARAFEAGSGLDEVKGICYKLGGQILCSKKRELVYDLDSLDYDLNLIGDWRRYITMLNGRPALLDVIESQRGCPFSCRFCHQSSNENYQAGKKILRAHSVGWVIDKARQLKKMTGVDYISFCDDEFWVNRNRSFEIIEKLNAIGLKFYKLRMRFGSLQDEEMIERLIANDIYTLNLGLESGVDRILDLMNKQLTTAQVLKKMRLLAKYPQVRVGSAIIIGSPTETKSEVMESVRFALRLCKENPNFNFGINLYKPLPGTDFFNMAIDLGFKPPKDIRGWSNIEHKLVYKIANSWLPWFNKREERNYVRVHNYIRLLSSARRNDAGRKIAGRFTMYFVKQFLKKMIGYVSYARIYNWYFSFPLDAYTYNIFRRWNINRIKQLSATSSR